MIYVIVFLFRATKRHLEEELIIWMGRRLLSIFLLVTLYLIMIENVHRLYLADSYEAGRFFLFERFLIVIPGLIHPPELFPGYEVLDTVIQEGVTSYSISYLEVQQTLGVVGVIGFAFMVGLRIMPLAPTEARVLPVQEI